MFEWIGEVVQAATVAYLVRNHPGTLMALAGAAIWLLLGWKHWQRSTAWRFNPRQAFDVGLAAVGAWLVGFGSWLMVGG